MSSGRPAPSFLRALRGELRALLWRRSTRVSLLLVILAPALHALLSSWYFRALAAAPEAGEEAGRRLNLWPRYATSAGLGLFLAELCVLVVVAGGLPREIQSGAARDPLSRGIGRPSWILARALATLAFTAVLVAGAVGSARLASGLLFEAGHITTEPILLFPGEDAAERRAVYEAFLEEHGLRGGDLAAWRDLSDDGRENVEAVREQLGLPGSLAYPEPDWEGWDFVPILLVPEPQVRADLRAGLLHALAPLAALSLYTLLAAAVFPGGALATMAALGSVLLMTLFGLSFLGDHAHVLFFDWLPWLGPDNLLAQAARVAEGFTDQPLPDPEALQAGTRGSWAAAVLFAGLLPWVFRRRRL